MKKIIYVTALTFFMLTVVEARDCTHCSIRNGFVKCPPGYSIQKSNGGWFRYVNNVNNYTSPCVMFTAEEAREIAWNSYTTNNSGMKCWKDYESTPIEDRSIPAPGYKIQISNGRYYRTILPDGYAWAIRDTIEEAIEDSWWKYDRDNATKTWVDAPILTKDILDIIDSIASESNTFVNSSNSICSLTNYTTSAYRLSISDENINKLCEQGDVCKVKGHCFIDVGPVITETVNRTFFSEQYTKRKLRVCKLCGYKE
jgi:signal peptidase I